MPAAIVRCEFFQAQFGRAVDGYGDLGTFFCQGQMWLFVKIAVHFNTGSVGNSSNTRVGGGLKDIESAHHYILETGRPGGPVISRQATKMNYSVCISEQVVKTSAGQDVYFFIPSIGMSWIFQVNPSHCITGCPQTVNDASSCSPFGTRDDDMFHYLSPF